MAPMLTLAVRRCAVDVDPAPILTAWLKTLSSEWKPVLAPAVAAQAEVLGIDARPTCAVVSMA